jgi:hypothetical protein
MQLTHQHRKNITAGYCIIFYILVLYKWHNGLLMYQVKPFLYSNKFDIFSWALMKTGIHQWLQNNPTGWIIFDVIFYSLPLILWLNFLRSIKASAIVAAIMLVVNMVYIQCFTLYPTNSIEGHIALLLFPFLFITINLKSFHYVLNALRYFTLFFFSSAGFWKIVEYGIFDLNQMSGILLYQHKEYLVSSPGYWYTEFVYWLINHPQISYLFYVTGTLLELSFAIGFFTKKYDKLLIAGFILFLLLDMLLMRINYWEVSPLLLTLFYSKYRLPQQTKPA